MSKFWAGDMSNTRLKIQNPVWACRGWELSLGYKSMSCLRNTNQGERMMGKVNALDRRSVKSQPRGEGEKRQNSRPKDVKPTSAWPPTPFHSVQLKVGFIFSIIFLSTSLLVWFYSLHFTRF